MVKGKHKQTVGEIKSLAHICFAGVFCQSINSFSQKLRKKVKFNVPTAPTVHSYFHSSSKHKFLSLYFIKQLLSVAGSLSVIKAWSGLDTNYYESQLALKNKKENANIDATTTKGCCSSRICAPPPPGRKSTTPYRDWREKTSRLTAQFGQLLFRN